MKKKSFLLIKNKFLLPKFMFMYIKNKFINNVPIIFY